MGTYYIVGVKNAGAKLSYILFNGGDLESKKQANYQYDRKNASEIDTRNLLKSGINFDEFNKNIKTKLIEVPVGSLSTILETGVGNLTANGIKYKNIVLDKNIKASYKKPSKILDTLGIRNGSDKEYITVLSEIYAQNSTGTFRLEDRCGYRVVHYKRGACKVRTFSPAKFEELLSQSTVEVINCGVASDGSNKRYLRFSDVTHKGIAMEIGSKAPKKEATPVATPTKTTPTVTKPTTPSTEKSSSIYTKEQLKELKLGKEHNVNVKLYTNPDIPAERMQLLRKAMEKGANVLSISKFAPTKIGMTDSAFKGYVSCCYALHLTSTMISVKAKDSIAATKYATYMDRDIDMKNCARKLEKATPKGSFFVAKDFGKYFEIKD